VHLLSTPILGNLKQCQCQPGGGFVSLKIYGEMEENGKIVQPAGAGCVKISRMARELHA